MIATNSLKQYFRYSIQTFITKNHLLMKMSAIKFLIAALSTSIIFYACSRSDKNVNSNKARFQVALTDDPGNYEAVYIDVQDVKINLTADTSGGWQSLANVHTGQYDVLKLVNDDDTILADAEINPGTVEQIRLVLGPNNFVKINGQMIPLETPSAQQSGLKLNIHQTVEAGLLYKLLLDFDVAKSIVKTGNSKYILKPVIRTTLEAAGGSIKGYVKPFNFQTAVLVFRGPNDTVASTYSSLINGGYLVRGLNAGSYSLHFMPTDTMHYRDTVISGVNVTTGMVTVVDTTRLRLK